MFKEATKLLAVALSACTCLTACDNSKEIYRAEADGLVAKAKEAIGLRQYATAVSLLDSLDSAYSKATDSRREGMHLRTLAMEGLTLSEIRTADSLSVASQLRGDSLARMLQKVSNPIEPYFVGPGQNIDVHGTTGLYARLMPDGTLYMISSVAGRKVNHVSVTVSGDGASATTATVPHDGEQNDRSSGTEIINYTGSQCDTIAKLIAANPAATYSLTFNGSTPYTITLPEPQKKAIDIIARFMKATDDVKRYSAQRTNLEKRLELIRSQMARTYRDSTDTAR